MTSLFSTRTIFAAFVLAVACSAPPAAASLAEKGRAEVLRLGDRFVSAPDHFEITSVRLSAVDTELDAAAKLDLARVESPNQAGIARAVFDVRLGDRLLRQVTFTVRGRVRGPALVARSTLAAHVEVPADAISLEEVDKTRVTGDVLRDLSGLTGLVPKRTLAKGRILALDQFKPTPTVRRGETLELVYAVPRLRITATAIAPRDAAAGELLELRMVESGAKVRGVVQPDGTVQVQSGSMGSRK